MMAQVTTLNIRGAEVPVEVDSHGKFRAVLNGDQFSSDTLGELQATLMRESKKASANIRIPFTQVNGPQVRHGAATSRNARTNAILVTWADGKKGQLERWGGTTILEPLDDAAVAELQKLSEAESAARIALKSFIDARRIELGLRVDEAVKAAIS